MSRAALLAALVAVLACSKKDDDNAPVVSAPPRMNLAGTWSVQVMPENEDKTLLIYMLTATNNSTGWKMTLPNRRPMDVRVLSLTQDSLVFGTEGFPSMLQPGIQVTSTHTNARMQGDTIVGKTIAHYDVKGPDSVRVLRTIGTRQ